MLKNAKATGLILRTAATAVVIISLLTLSLFSMVNSFFRHMTPDNSIYLLQTRTFLNTFNRFGLSFESKGLILTLLLLPGVGLFGANITAVAFSHLWNYSLGFIFLLLIIRRYSAGSTAVILGLMFIILAYSPNLWGANGRPEDFYLTFSAIALYAGLRGGKIGIIICGAMIALIAFTKISLALAPGLLGVSAAAANSFGDRRSEGQRNPTAKIKSLTSNFGLLLLGFIGIGGIVLGWIALSEDIVSWHRQTMQWPLECFAPGLSWESAGSTFKLLKKAGVNWLFYGCLAGMIFGLSKGPRRPVFLVLALATGDFLRISTEIVYPPGWHYLLLPLIIPILLGNSFFGMARPGSARAMLGWIIPLCLLTGVLRDSLNGTWKCFTLRAVRGLRSPYEYLAEAMRKSYSPTESIFVDSNDYQLLLLLNAPRPYPLLPTHFKNLSSEKERQQVQLYYAAHPPSWVIKREPQHSVIPFTTLGHVDGPFHIYLPERQGGRSVSESAKFLPGEMRSGQDLNPQLPPSPRYRLEIDLGYVQAWRRRQEISP